MYKVHIIKKLPFVYHRMLCIVLEKVSYDRNGREYVVLNGFKLFKKKA